MVLVMLVNIIYDVANGNAVFNFFTISINNGILYGRLIDILNRGQRGRHPRPGHDAGRLRLRRYGYLRGLGGCRWRAACAACCWPALATSTSPEYAIPLWLGVLAGILVACLCGAFNGFPGRRSQDPAHGRNAHPLLRRDAPSACCFATATSSTSTSRASSSSAATAGSSHAHPDYGAVHRGHGAGPQVHGPGAPMCRPWASTRKPPASPATSRRRSSSSAMWCAACSRVSRGITATSRIYSADTNNIGLNLEMDAILAVALGGATAWAAASSACPAPSSAPTPFRPSPPRSYALGVSSAQAPVFKAVIVILIVTIQSPAVKALLRQARRRQERHENAGREAQHDSRQTCCQRKEEHEQQHHSAAADHRPVCGDVRRGLHRLRGQGLYTSCKPSWTSSRTTPASSA